MLADALGIKRFNWVGWSSGGDVGLILAALHGPRLGRMVSHAGVAGGKNTGEPGGVLVPLPLLLADSRRIFSWPAASFRMRSVDSLILRLRPSSLLLALPANTTTVPPSPLTHPQWPRPPCASWTRMPRCRWGRPWPWSSHRMTLRVGRCSRRAA
jgi:pimeloyl-ACP methyl ester carboxylesterase